MATVHTYPGVFIEEVPSGVRTITGVATSVTAFIGRAVRGPVNEPITINGFGDFERIFGGLWIEGPMSYAVRDFYQNGGKQAIIVRLFGTPGGGADGVATLEADDGLVFEAASTGAWGNNLTVAIDREGVSDEVAQRFDVSVDALFNLTLADGSPGGRAERLRNLTVEEGSRHIDRVLARESQLARVRTLSATPPKDTAAPISADGGDDGLSLTLADYTGSRDGKKGLYALEKANLFNLLCIPPEAQEEDTDPGIYRAAMAYCKERRAVLIVDPPAAWGGDATSPAAAARDGLAGLRLSGALARNAALYFPRVVMPDPLRSGQPGTFVPCGAVAGVISRTDAERGVWKAPAGLDASLSGIQRLEADLTDAENGMLNPLGINCLRSLGVGGPVVWGARTLRGADQLADEYKYLPVRRMALYIEESLYRGTQWVVFEENDEPLWAQIRLNIRAFMNTLFRQGAFQGTSPRDAYFVKCDRETTTQDDINRGVVNILVGFAPLKPAEFVVIKIQQITDQSVA